MVEINLYAHKLQKLNKKQRLKQLTWKSILAGVLVLAVLMIALSGFSLVVAGQNQALTDKIEAEKAKIKNLEPVESKQVYLISKLDAFGQLVKTQEKHQAVAEAVFTLLPDNTSLKGFQVSEEGLINLSGSVPDYPTLLELLSRIANSRDLGVPVVSAKVNSIGVSTGGGIDFAIDVLIGVNQWKLIFFTIKS